jgi:acetoin utilization protein AcuB
MKTKQIMTTKIVTVEFDDFLHAVKSIFDHMKFHHLLVVEEQKLYGVISDRDLFKALSPNIGTLGETSKDLATLNKRVHQIMSRHPITLSPEASLYEAIEVFNTHRISCIPIVDEQQKPLGIISWRDIFRVLGDKIKKTGH